MPWCETLTDVVPLVVQILSRRILFRKIHNQFTIAAKLCWPNQDRDFLVGSFGSGRITRRKNSIGKFDVRKVWNNDCERTRVAREKFSVTCCYFQQILRPLTALMGKFTEYSR